MNRGLAIGIVLGLTGLLLVYILTCFFLWMAGTITTFRGSEWSKTLADLKGLRLAFVIGMVAFYLAGSKRFQMEHDMFLPVCSKHGLDVFPVVARGSLPRGILAKLSDDAKTEMAWTLGELHQRSIQLFASTTYGVALATYLIYHWYGSIPPIKSGWWAVAAIFVAGPIWGTMASMAVMGAGNPLFTRDEMSQLFRMSQAMRYGPQRKP